MSTSLLENILHQPQSIQSVGAYQLGHGRDALLRAADMLRAKKKIILSGMGASCSACIPFQYRLIEDGFSVMCVETAELLYFLRESLNEDTAVVLVSRSGESIEAKRLLEQLAPTGAAIVGVANVPDSTLARSATHAVIINSPADQMVAIQTYTGTLLVFALLAAALHGTLEQAYEELQHTIDLLESYIPQWVEHRIEWHGFLEGAHPLYLLGRGSSLGAVAEGVLLMHETAKAPTVGMTVPQFRHGAVEVVDADFRAVVFGTQERTVDLDAALANDLARMGGEVRWLGPAIEGNIAQSLVPWPSSRALPFEAIWETIPLQILAYTKAELRGLKPGEFRWSPAITSTEAAGFLPQVDL